MHHYSHRLVFSFIFFLTLSLARPAISGERRIVQLKDFSSIELQSQGFSLLLDAQLHIIAVGAGSEKGKIFSTSTMYAYGWILDAKSRKTVWEMDQNNTLQSQKDKKFDGEIFLPKGDYEVYFVAYGFGSPAPFSNFNIDIDRRKKTDEEKKSKKRNFFSWFEDFFGRNDEKEWKSRSKKWGIDLYIKDGSVSITTFKPPKDFPNTIYKATRLGENDHIKQAFVLSKSIPIHIYAIGEMNFNDDLADYGWIINAKTRERVWEMKSSNLPHAGGADKNVKFDDVVVFPSGEYVLYFNTDDSHSSLDWNAAPPNDPLNLGIQLITPEQNNMATVKLTTLREDENIIVQLTQAKNNETRSASFTLKMETQIRVYALGEASNERRLMADYGWIINAKTRERIWIQDVQRTMHAGGADKNRMIDEIITLPKGTYTVYYKTDDSHAYNNWNTIGPFDPEHWGITLSGIDENFDMKNVEKNINVKEAGVIIQINQVDDHADKTTGFKLEKPTRIRIYALGEGQNREMYDYGWIEDAHSSRVIWEMTYSMTFHAGGGRKNRIVTTTILLDRGEYNLRYISDDSHSFGNWNTDPPDDPTMWGITLYKEE